MQIRTGNLYFGGEIDERFRLHIRIDELGNRTLMLLRNEVAQPKVMAKSLVLLQFFLEHPKEILLKSTIQEALSLTDFDKNLSNLRIDGLDDKEDEHRIIETLPRSNGYRFKLSVTRDGDLGTDVYPRWRAPIFDNLLNEVTRSSDSKIHEDLRIVTVAFGSGVQELGFDELLRRGARVRIIMTDPLAEVLIRARHGHRQDSMTPAKGKLEILSQIEELRVVAKDGVASGYEGSIELALSSAMPGAFIAHTYKRALAGMFLAQCSYLHGPMIEAQRDTAPWCKLYDDWHIRWERTRKKLLLTAKAKGKA
jgi:hypothetical protein